MVFHSNLACDHGFFVFFKQYCMTELIIGINALHFLCQCNIHTNNTDLNYPVSFGVRDGLGRRQLGSADEVPDNSAPVHIGTVRVGPAPVMETK